MEEIKLSSTTHSNFEFSDFCKKIIDETEIIIIVCNLKVRYVRENGFRVFDLFNFANKQYLIEENYFGESDDELDDDSDKVYEEDEINWNGNPTKNFEHTLHGFYYDKETKTVTCKMSH